MSGNRPKGPSFGKKLQGVEYRHRPSAYGILSDGEGQIAYIETPNGPFLPGGGVERDESYRACLTREFREETGLHVAVGEFLGSASRYFFAASEDTHFEGEGHFFTCSATATGSVESPSDPEYVLKWARPEEIRTKFFHEHHGWAVERFVESRESNLAPSKRRTS
ncbi:MAG: NUDIX domain-containing protein [Planctomycetota bacterium]